MDATYNELLISEDPSEMESFEEKKPKKKCYRSWYMILLYILLGIIVILAITLWIVIVFAEYGQCTRSCKLELCEYPNMSECLLGNTITGKRKKASDRKKCICQAPELGVKDLEIDRYAAVADTWSIDKNETRYCAVPQNSTSGNGVTYASKSDAEADNALLLHLGPCGTCSSISDKDAYNKTAQTLTKTSTKAAIAAVFGEGMARNILRKTNLSEKCIDCWIGNIHQTLIHCFGRCIFGDRSGCNKNGELTDCLYCDEVYSGMYFRKCAGMTRRRAGIVTDICRKPGEVVE
ncbi:hypothetical protein GPJ56_000983 [Histomonas meleagridis]|uniref:uncharacterized protein n=1 Tax=Histomonas meleagridis TaxID=135588 RepID=UPI00355A2636|nr:hypothetical protein GPJ56_000983 [Histomonas meleagridis]KAH0803820.1 hypothetical protein GO595_002650 [Histomonas meleagridis]